MSARKNLPPPAQGVADITAALHARRDDDAPRTPRTSATGTAGSTSARGARSRTPMDRRSWYMPRASAEALAALVEDLHYETRRPKHEVLAAVVAAALGQKDAVHQQLKEER